MIRVKDAEKSLKYYQEIIGMKLLRTHEASAAGFNLYFLGFGDLPAGAVEGVNPVADQEGILELTWNYGTEKDENFSYHDGNKEPQGFGHIALTVDDLDAACARFEEKGARWKKRLTDGRMKNVAFLLGKTSYRYMRGHKDSNTCIDPDGYWIELVQNEKLKQRSNW